jgi:hypothetical protein
MRDQCQGDAGAMYQPFFGRVVTTKHKRCTRRLQLSLQPAGKAPFGEGVP